MLPLNTPYQDTPEWNANKISGTECRRTLAAQTARRFLPRHSTALLLALGAFGICGPVRAQEPSDPVPADAAKTPAKVVPPAAVQAADLPPIRFRERPKVASEPQRLRRTPTIDGVQGESEYTPFYTLSDGLVKGTVYCNWDNDFLYVAARTDQPCGLVIDVDMGGDGWLRGADNLEIVVGSIVEGQKPEVTTRLLDAASSKEAPVWNETSIDPKSISIAGRITNGGQWVELAIPKNTASLVLRPGATLGLRVEPLPPGPVSAYTPTPPFEPHLLLDATLVEAQVQAFTGVTPRLTLSDAKCVAGQNLFATLELVNQTDTPLPIRSVLWTGTGNSVNAVNTIREVTVPTLSGLKSQKLRYRTVLPPNLAPGSYTLTVTADMGEGKTIQSAASFTVVEPIQVQMLIDPNPVTIVGQTKLTVSIDVFSSVPNHFRGDVELTTVPSGWELAGSRKRGLSIDREDARHAARYTFKIPSTTAGGNFPVEAIVTWRGREFRTRGVAHLVTQPNPVALPAAAPGSAAK